ncbi:MAG TPA: family 16 glycoside hydrolase, partial [Gemmataceae bacterium]|nr:family 16 glycoside hydrolase [Gemmataceae bacterium]
MTVQRGTHPSADVLKAFALGKLNDGSADGVLIHLDQCQQCRQEVAALSGDDFLNRLRQARGQSFTPAPANTLAGAARAAKPFANRTPVANLPPELAANQQYEILRELGRGGMGVVYLAKNKLMDRLEVLKVVNKTLLDHPGAVERFLREIRSAAKLSHANVVGAYHALQMGELLAFAMEYIEGQDLASLVKSQGPLPVPHACFYVQQAALGLQHAFEKQMVHRDIKPQNLILAREGKKHIVKVLDFGLAKVMREKSEDTGLTGEGKMLGTPDYIAPEQTLDAAKADIRADIYSLGCTLYYLLSGHPPFSASSLGAILVAHQMHEAKPLNLERPEVPEELAAVVRKMMAKSPAKRYQTPLDVVQALSPFVKQGAMPKPSPELSSGTAESKPVIKTATRVDPPPAPAAEAPKQPPAPAAVWESLTENSAASIVPRKSAIVRKPLAATLRERKAQKKWLMGGGAAVGLLLLALLGMWAGGVFKVKTPEGTLIVEVNEPNPEVLLDDKTMTVSWHNGGKKAEIRVKPGTHKVEVKKDGFTVYGEEVEIEDGKRRILTAKLVQPPVPPKEENADALPLKETPPQPDTNTPDTPQVVGVADGDKGFVPLFNGKDKTGWKTHPKQSDNWRVVKGTNGNVLTCSGVVAGYLYSERGDYRDFHLLVEARINDEGHGGVYIRAPFGPQIPRDNPTYPIGYEALINRSNINGTGSLLDGGEGTTFSIREVPIPRDQWFWMEAIAQGDRIIVKVNDKTTADYQDKKQRFTSGYIALEQFGAGTKIEFRTIKIKELVP